MPDRDEPEILGPDELTPDPAARAHELYEASLGLCDASRVRALRELERIAEAYPEDTAVVEALARAHCAVTEDCCGAEAERSLATLRRLVANRPTTDEPRRQLCYALFNRYCDEGVDAYLIEMHAMAAPLPDRDELTGMGNLEIYLSGDDEP